MLISGFSHLWHQIGTCPSAFMSRSIIFNNQLVFLSISHKNLPCDDIWSYQIEKVPSPYSTNKLSRSQMDFYLRRCSSSSFGSIRDRRNRSLPLKVLCKVFGKSLTSDVFCVATEGFETRNEERNGTELF